MFCLVLINLGDCLLLLILLPGVLVDSGHGVGLVKGGGMCFLPHCGKEGSVQLLDVACDLLETLFSKLTIIMMRIVKMTLDCSFVRLLLPVTYLYLLTLVL